MTKLSDTQRTILSLASQRDDRMVVPPARLPAAARMAVAKSLIKQGLAGDEHASAHSARDAWQIDGRTWLLRITRGAHTLSLLLEDGVSIRAADMPNADDPMLRIYAAMAQKERELISERTRAALAAAKARGTALGGDRGYRPAVTLTPQQLPWRGGRRRCERRTG